MGAIHSGWASNTADQGAVQSATDALDLRGLDLAAVRALADTWGLRQLTFGLEHSTVESAIGKQLALCASSSSSSSTLPPLAAELVERFDPEGSGLVDALELVSALILAARVGDTSDGTSIPMARAAALFDAFDFEGRGYLEYDEFGLMLGAMARGALTIFDPDAADAKGVEVMELQGAGERTSEGTSEGAGKPLQADDDDDGESLVGQEQQVEKAQPSLVPVPLPLSDSAFLAADADHDGLVHRGEWLEYATAVATEMTHAKLQWVEAQSTHKQAQIEGQEEKIEEKEEQEQGGAATSQGVVRLGVGDVLLRMQLARRLMPVNPLLVSATVQRALDDSIDVLEGLEQAVLVPLESGVSSAVTHPETNENVNGNVQGAMAEVAQ